MAQFHHDAATDHELTLADGRRMTYSVFGTPDGTPVLNCHGGLVCRFDVEPCADEFVVMGLRVISPDRPGVGGSDRQPGRSTGDWADDARELLDALSIDRAAVMGWSLGGQYAAAVAARLGDRVTKLAIIAGCPPLNDDERFAELNRLDRRLAALVASDATGCPRHVLAVGAPRPPLAVATGALRSQALTEGRRRRDPRAR